MPFLSLEARSARVHLKRGGPALFPSTPAWARRLFTCPLRRDSPSRCLGRAVGRSYDQALVREVSEALLHSVHQLVAQQSALIAGHRLPGTKHEMAPDRERRCVGRVRRACSPLIAVHPDAAQIMTEARLPLGAVGRRQRFAGGLESITDEPESLVSLRPGPDRLCGDRRGTCPFPISLHGYRNPTEDAGRLTALPRSVA